MKNRAKVLHPLRVALMLTALLTIVFAASAPMLPFVLDPVAFTLAGIGYGLFLSVFAIGMTLALHTRLFRFWLILVAVLWGAFVVHWIWFQPLVFADDLDSTHFSIWLRLGQAATAIVIIFGAVVSTCGWIGYKRSHRSAD
jgi:hypothetical protein